MNHLTFLHNSQNPQKKLFGKFAAQHKTAFFLQMSQFNKQINRLSSPVV